MKTIIIFTIALFSGLQTPQKDTKTKEKETTLVADAKDPVCKMHVSKGTKTVSTYKGKQYGFCSVVCKEMFDKKPEKYVK
ncbi:YHS domain-containing protein [Flectobacillus major]|jgi:YHS domain-containing protein|uniref:YHS domain-containing protein n=1 Tax=Flectobacillus major TaxID=103 RepID=UPI00041A2280|nr:YHS domain-containing protein [Flectobacillus major]